MKTVRAQIKHERKLLHIKKKLSLRALYYPSWSSFGIISLVFTLFFLLSHFISLPENLCFGKINLVDSLNYLESSHYQNLISILAGIGAIIFALVIFVAESIRDDDTKDKARVLLRESFLFPLATAELLTFFLFIWGSVNVFIIIPILIIGLLTIYSLARLIRILLNKHKYAQKREELLKERLIKSINEAIDERLGNNILLAKLNDKDIKLEFNIFADEKESQSYLFKADTTGVIIDIDLEKLKRIADLIEREANRNNFSFTERAEIAPPYVTDREGRSVSSTTPKTSFNILRKRYLFKKYHDQVNEERNVLISVDRALIKDRAILKKIDALVKKAFIIGPMDTYTDEVRSELAGIKDQFINSIINKQTGKVEEYSTLYIHLAESFFEAISVFGGGYSSALALKERHALSGGWAEIRWLTEDIRDFIPIAIKSGEMAIIKELTFLPFAIAVRAISKRDHYIFQEFVQFSDFLYLFANKEDDKEIRAFLFDRSWRYLKEIAGFYIETKMTADNDNLSDLANMKEFAIYFYMIFQGLLKRSVDNQNIDMFDIYKRATLDLFSSMKTSEASYAAEEIRWNLKRMDLPKEERERLERTLNVENSREDIAKDLTLKKSQMFFGLASWLAFEVKNIYSETIYRIYDSIQDVFSNKIEEITELFIKTHSFNVEDFWGWPRWDIHEGEGFHSINILGKLELFYVIRSLSILGNMGEEEINKTILPHNRDFAFLVEGTRDLNAILDDITSKPDSWRPLLSDKAMGKVEAFKQILNVAKVSQEREELDLKRKKDISVEKQEEFKTDLINEYYKDAGMKSVFMHFGLYENNMGNTLKVDKSRFGINTVDDKAAFFEDWHVHYSGWGENYGRIMALGENGSLLDELERLCVPSSEDNIDDILRGIKDPENILMIASYTTAWIHKLRYRNDKKIDNSFFSCWYESGGFSIPVFRVYSQSHEEKLLILNSTKCGKLVQETPINKGEDRKRIKDIFYLNIKSFSEDNKLLEEFLNKSIDWLNGIGDKQRQKEHLQERVLVQVYERYEFQRAESFEGYCVKHNASAE